MFSTMRIKQKYITDLSTPYKKFYIGSYETFFGNEPGKFKKRIWYQTEIIIGTLHIIGSTMKMIIILSIVPLTRVSHEYYCIIIPYIVRYTLLMIGKEYCFDNTILIQLLYRCRRCHHSYDYSISSNNLFLKIIVRYYQN